MPYLSGKGVKNTSKPWIHVLVLFGWIAGSWEAHFRNYRHYVINVPSAPCLACWTDYPISLTKTNESSLTREGMGWPRQRFFHLLSESPWVGINLQLPVYQSRSMTTIPRCLSWVSFMQFPDLPYFFYNICGTERAIASGVQHLFSITRKIT